MSRFDAVVIGAGHNGLVAAAGLARTGLSTLVVERSDAPGGCAATEEVWPGTRVDIGAHGAGALDPRVVAELGLEREGLEIVRPEAAVVAPQPGGGALVLWRDPARTAASIRRFSEADARRWPDFLGAMATAARGLEILYRADPPRIAGADRRDLWELLRLGGRLGRLGRAEALELGRLLPMTIEELLDEWFESDALRGALAAAGITGIFQGPMASGTAYVFLHGLVGSHGVVRERRWVKGGMGRLGEALAGAARAAGAELRLGAAVERILVRDGAARGVRLASGEEIPAARVVSSADPRMTFERLVDPLALDAGFARAVRNIRYRGACAKVHLALGSLPAVGEAGSEAREALAAGAAISIAPNVAYLERAYDDAKHGAPSAEPYVEAVLPTTLDRSLAPEDRHVLSALVQYAPYRLRDGTSWEERRDGLADAVVDTLERAAPGLEAAVVDRHALTPVDLERRFGLAEGNIHHGEMTLDQLFFMRPVPGWSRYRTPIEGLYLCGAGAHPGAGLTGRPGRAAARAILADAKRRG